MEIRCFCPPESLAPRSPTKVSYPSGRDMINFMDIGLFCRLHDFLIGGSWFSIGDVFADGSAEQVNFLLNQSDAAAQAL